LGDEKKSINISSQLYNEIKKRYVDSGEFESVEEFVELVLREFLQEEDYEEAYSPEEEEQIKERLRSLGYL